MINACHGGHSCLGETGERQEEGNRFREIGRRLVRESQGRGQYLGKQSQEEPYAHGGAAGQSGSKPLGRMAKTGAGGSEVLADWGVKSYLSVIMDEAQSTVCAVPGLRPSRPPSEGDPEIPPFHR